MLETDSPVEYRGNPSEPAVLPKVAKALAELKGASIEEIVKTTTRNAERLFKI